MCGIVGYIGSSQAEAILLDGLQRLEYRGYDSAGIAVVDASGNLCVEKRKGKLQNLRDHLADHPLQGYVGIGHTRWATHGKPSDENAHPHVSNNGKFAVVHNGIIENYLQLKEKYLMDVPFQSQTDTEVVAQLLGYFYEGDFIEAVRKTVSVIEGAYTLVILCADFPDQIIACRKSSPLVLGIGEGENFLASDVPALLAHTRKCIYVNDMELCVLTKDTICIYNQQAKPVEYEVKEIQWSAEAAEKGGFEHFMLKEIFEQPAAFGRTLSGRMVDGKVDFADFDIDSKEISRWRKIHIVACGTAYHSGLVGRTVFEKLANIPTEVEVASEFRYRDPILDQDTLVIAISQSGETADTLAALKSAKAKGCKVLAITNVVGSAVAREADYVLYLMAGPEISVASTKAYTTMLIAQYLLGIYFAQKKGLLSAQRETEMLATLQKLPQYTKEILQQETLDELIALAEKYKDVNDFFFIGRGMDWSIAMEGALKLKEISYIHAEAYAAGELKHGTLALITKDTPVIALAVQGNTYEKTLSNIKEITAREAEVLAIVKNGDTEMRKVADHVLYLPNIDDFFMPVLSVVPLQLVAYYIAKARGCSIDQPRNLAKSVTVE